PRPQRRDVVLPRRARREGHHRPRRVLRRQPRQAPRGAAVALPPARSPLVRAAARCAGDGPRPPRASHPQIVMSVTTQTNGPVFIVSIARQGGRNAVARPSAEALSAAFERFDADPALSVAILTGAGGTFCAGADLKGFAEGRGNRVAPDGPGPMGPSRMLLGKPVVAAVEGYAVAG